MIRRDILKLPILGLFAGHSLWWRGGAPLRLPIDQPPEVFPLIRTALVMSDGSSVEGPGVVNISRLGNDLLVKMAPVEARSAITVVGSNLMDKDGVVIEKERFIGGPVSALNGDRINIEFKCVNYYDLGILKEVSKDRVANRNKIVYLASKFDRRLAST